MPTRVPAMFKPLIVLLLPILVIGGSVNLLATDQYLALEYAKASFPADPFGFTQQQRFELASSNIHYVRAHLPHDALTRQTLNGNPIYNSREISHMADVRGVLQSVMRIWWFVVGLLILMGSTLWQTKERHVLVAAIRSGGLLTSGMILSIAGLAIFAWQFWFELFHLFFFNPGSWLFSYSDTLIRLFPVEFWFDATLTFSLLSLSGAVLLTWLGWQGRRALVERV